MATTIITLTICLSVTLKGIKGPGNNSNKPSNEKYVQYTIMRKQNPTTIYFLTNSKANFLLTASHDNS